MADADLASVADPKALPAPIAQCLSALIPDVLACTLMGDDFVQLVRTQTESWRAVARASNVEVIG